MRRDWTRPIRFGGDEGDPLPLAVQGKQLPTCLDAMALGKAGWEGGDAGCSSTHPD
jgi:hypothetical protein